MDPVAMVRTRGGVMRVRDLAALGVTRRELGRLLEQSVVCMLRRGVVTLDSCAPVSVAALHGGALACVSALRRMGVWILADEDRVHVALGANGRAHPHEGCACVEHRDGTTFPLGSVDIRTALVQASRCLPNEQFFAALESAMFQRLVTARDVAWIRHHVSRGIRVVVALARWDAESGLESILRLRLWFLGYELRSQVYIPGVGRVDFLVDNVIIEADGRQNHADGAHRHKDHVRDAAARAAGYRVARFDFAMIIYQWELVEAALVAMLGPSAVRETSVVHGEL